jgi:predicted membrane channel-forming protein YqfA (hemolysin III family)
MSDDQDIEHEERAIYLLLICVCTPILVSLAIRGGFIDGGNTLILIVVALALAGFLAGLGVIRRSRSRRRGADIQHPPR